MDDREAILRLKRGDVSGLELLMGRYQVQAARAAFLITQDLALAQDVVQETFIRIYDRIRQFDDSRPFEPYLMRSVVHAALNAVRGDFRFASLDDDTGRVEILLEHAELGGIPGGVCPDATGAPDCSLQTSAAPKSRDRSTLLSRDERKGNGTSLEFRPRHHKVVVERRP